MNLKKPLTYNTRPPTASNTAMPSHAFIALALTPIKAEAPLIVLAFEKAMLGVSSEELVPYT
jgi:hypothetical protein